MSDNNRVITTLDGKQTLRINTPSATVVDLGDLNNTNMTVDIEGVEKQVEAVYALGFDGENIDAVLAAGVPKILLTADDDALILENPVWDDSKFPLTGQRLDTSAGRTDYNYFNGGVDFQDNARYPEEPISMLDQLSHKWKPGTNALPHLHWLQTVTGNPNWLLAYQILPNEDDTRTKNIDYSNHTLVKGVPIFNYVSGVVDQITVFPEIDLSSYADQTSLKIHYVLFRDSGDVSGLFGSSDTGLGTIFAYEFDVHMQYDRLGSNNEFSN